MGRLVSFYFKDAPVEDVQGFAEQCFLRGLVETNCPHNVAMFVTECDTDPPGYEEMVRVANAENN